MSPHEHLLVTNSVALNGGDAAILFGLLRGARHAFGDDLHVDVADEAFEAARRAYPGVSFVAPLHGSAVRPRGGFEAFGRSLRRRRVTVGSALLGVTPRLARAALSGVARAQMDRIRAAGAVVSTGGTYLVEHYPLRRRLEAIEASVRLGAPTYLYTQSLGPFLRRRNARRVASALGRVARVFLRAQRSRDHLLEIGVPGHKLSVHPDAAFALARPAQAAPEGTRRVAVSVRHWPHYRRADPSAGQAEYRAGIAAVVKRLVADGARVTFVSTCQGQPDYRTDDSRYAARIVDEHLRGVPGVEVDAAFRTPDELIEELAGYHLAIATRMHFAILALCAGVPVAPIAYEFKTEELFSSLGWGDRVVELETMTADSLWDSVESTLRDADALREELARLLPALKEAAMEPALRIRDDLQGGAP
jgi:colanic acid/amylovoran biosynthesis protein